MADVIAGFVKKLGPRPISRPDAAGGGRPLAPITKAATLVGLASAAASVLAFAHCATVDESIALTPVPVIYLEPVDTSALVPSASANVSSGPIPPTHIHRLAGVPAHRFPQSPPVAQSEPVHQGPTGIVVRQNEGALH